MICPGDVITAPRGTYTIGNQYDSDELFETFDADVNGRHVTLRVAASTAVDDDLVVNEALSLAGLTSWAADNDPRLTPYLPNLVDTFDGPEGQVNAFDHLDGFHSLLEVLDVYPNGVDPRDMAWMYRRLLVAIGLTHDAGYVHGAVLPQNVYIHPELHGLVLHNWTHAAPYNPEHHALAESFGPYPLKSDWYPLEVRSAHPIMYPSTDIFMATQIAMWLIGGDIGTLTLPSGTPNEYHAFFSGCVKPRHQDRPQNALDLLQYFNQLIERLYGKRTFRPFTLTP